MKSLGKKIRLVLLLLIMTAGQTGLAGTRQNVAEAADKELAQKPYMGWSSFSMQVYEPSGNWISADSIKKQSDAMHEKLQPHGYEYINIDAGWNGSMDEYGRPLPSTERYPDGFQDVIDYVHNNGQKIGIYLIPGLSIDAYNQDLEIYGTGGECRVRDIAAQPLKIVDAWNAYSYKIDFSNPCAQKYVESIADMLGEWGIDFVKFDSVTPGSGINNLSLDSRGDVEAWSKALARHDIWFELSWALDHNYVDFWKKYANGWRIQWDVEAYDSNVGLTQWANIARLFPDAAVWWRDAGPGGWNDFDSLNVGNAAMDGLTRDERQTAMTFWAVSAAQLYIGNDMTRLDDYGLQLLTNDEVIAVNQAGRPAHPVSTDTKQQVWYANNGDGTYNVALFNLGSRSAAVNVKWNDIGLEGPASVRDLWSHSELGTFNDGYSAGLLEPHASRMFKVTAKEGVSVVNDDDTGLRYTGDWQRNGGQEQMPGSQDLQLTITDSTPDPGTEVPGDGGQPGGGAEGEPGAGGGATVSRSVYVNDSNPGIIYSGSWSASTGRSAGDHRGDVHYTEQNGDYFRYTFTGTGIELLTEKDSSQGDMLVYLDDAVIPDRVSTYTPGNKEAQQIVYSASGLAEGEHTLKVVKDSGQYMLLDALRITAGQLMNPLAGNFDKGSGKQADLEITLAAGTDSLLEITNGGTPLQPGADYNADGNKVTVKKEYLVNQPSAGAELLFSFDGGSSEKFTVQITGSSTVRYELVNNDDAAITYNGSWSRSTGRGMGDYKDDVQYTEMNGDSFEYDFSGTGISLYTETDSSQGDMDIYIDGEFKETVSAYHNGRQAQQNLFSVSGLPEGIHTLKAVKKSGSFMLLDMLKVEIPDLINPVEADFDKAAGAGTDIEITLLRRPELFGGIRQGAYQLEKGKDYTITGSTVTLSQDYLSARPAGTLSLTFEFGGDYQNDVHYSEQDGDFFEYAFTGSGIALAGPTGPALGDIELYVDGELLQTVSAHSENRQILQSLAVISGLDEGRHVLKVVKKSGGYMLVDQLRITLAAEDDGSGEEPGETPAPTPAATPEPAATPAPTATVQPGGNPAPAVTVSPAATVTPAVTPAPSGAPGTAVDGHMPHTAYAKGYPGGLFKPDQKITRAEMAALLFAALPPQTTGAAPSFTDVNKDHWAAAAVSGVAGAGLMTGYSDGTFRPGQLITRAELASLAAAFLPADSAAGRGFTDVAGHWAAAAILKAQGAGVLSGYSDGSFKPRNPLTRAEVVTVINRLTGRGPLHGITASPWRDVPLTHWAYADIMEASVDHVWKPADGSGEQLSES
ncbi:X2-like carbohydrate binding domain-containing protein [Paenibacillus sp. MMS20-IR301]|uniref:X2-like carbohydrate binding domain-containing protein n=1 Tax=Paenibacillus sp. MMS20-IR301 TaxID=2895946 RepID=UPI0028E9B965|nr:S-layer homology domain-containing protein [Paenibacillus sp. MMS20-IR301]WNS46720.1 S-layer homology domain-containing protein [Paenibacillus sp. MMS20-IR301]